MIKSFSKTKKIIDEHIKVKGYNQPHSSCSQVVFAMDTLRKLHSENNHATKHTENVIKDIINNKNNKSLGLIKKFKTTALDHYSEYSKLELNNIQT